MIEMGATQRAVLGLDTGKHARVLGAPGTGKSRALVEVYAHALETPGWSESDVIALAPGRLSAGMLRTLIEQRVQRALGGTPARTPTSLGFAVLAQTAAVSGAPAPRLLTGTVQDEGIAEAVERLLGEFGAEAVGAGLNEEVVRTPTFRAEVREFWRVLDDFDIEPSRLRAELLTMRGQAATSALNTVPPDDLIDRWVAAISVVMAAQGRLATERPGEYGASALLRAAAAEVRAGVVAAPQLILVDDAQELGEGQLALLAAFAAAGSRIWVFGDPDIATASFHGEHTRVLADLRGELARRGGTGVSGPATDVAEQLVILDASYRQTGDLRRLVEALSRRVGTAGVGAQRDAAPIEMGVGGVADEGAVRFARVSSPAEQLGVIAHRMRGLRLGLHGPAREWGQMAVLCRSRGEAARVARGLAGHQVPTGVTAGGIVLREHLIVKELIALLQRALGLRTFGSADVLDMLGGTIGGLDPVAVRRLRGALLLTERRDALEEQRGTRETDDLILEAFETPGVEPAVDSAGGRALRVLGLVAAAGVKVREAGGTPREMLWAIWDRARLADKWQEQALVGRGSRADEAGRSLDAVLGLFYALQRHEEQASEVPIEELLDELLNSSVPEDSLAQRAARDAVVVTTPQGAVGREFEFVAVLGPQDGVWPNTRTRGSLLGTVACERWLRGGEALPPSRHETIHDELRLFVQACSRPSNELLVVAISDEEQHPSPFFGFGRDFAVEAMPSSRLTLRGVTAQMRRRLTEQPDDSEAQTALVALARAEAVGAHPDEWYGVQPPSSATPLYDLADEGVRVPVSPSQLETAERCPLDWVVSSLGGGRGNVAASLGTLVHHALETAQSTDATELLDAIMHEWRKLPFDAEWESARAQRTAAQMAEGLSQYLREFDASDRHLIGKETSFSIDIGQATLRGMADRLEQRDTPEGAEVTVLDLKTGRTPPSKAEAEQHAQLQAYQLGVESGAFELADGTPLTGVVSGGARLLFVHPDAAKSAGFVERVQQPLSEERRAEFEQRVSDIAEVMAAGEFTARVEHHCSDPHQPGNCRLHIIQAVSHS